jgi:hypothetical protein
LSVNITSRDGSDIPNFSSVIVARPVGVTGFVPQRVLARPTVFGLSRFPRETRQEVPERDVARHLRNVLRLPIAVNLPLPRFNAGAARSVVMLEHRAAAHVKATHVPIEPRVIRKGIARVKLTGALYVGVSLKAAPAGEGI